VDREKKTWKISSLPASRPEFNKRTFEDIDRIFKARPENYKTTEERNPDGTFKSYTVETV